MAVSALAACITGTSAAMVLTIQDKQSFIFYDEHFELPPLSQFWITRENTKIFLCYKK